MNEHTRQISSLNFKHHRRLRDAPLGTLQMQIPMGKLYYLLIIYETSLPFDAISEWLAHWTSFQR